jgi:murein DD-endopeptidase MepM/ murein hydrolase activator NlpD
MEQIRASHHLGHSFIARRPLFTVIALLILAAGLWSLFWPGKLMVPVPGAGAHDWRPQSSWNPGWGQTMMHKGIDIFATQGAPVLAAGPGIVIFAGEWGADGKVVVSLGPDLCLHYYANLQSINAESGQTLAQGDVLGAVGHANDPFMASPHLHYAIISLVPRLWRWDDVGQGWKKMFILNPAAELGGWS